MKYILPLYVFILLLLATNCAKQTSPTGGPRDTIPPNLIQSIPTNGTIHFKEKSIQFVFDEYIAVNNPREQLLVTPSIGNKIEMEVRKKSVLLSFNAELEDSTTYTINFRESVQDITEKNPAQNLFYAFSTGSYLDSLSIKGEITDLQSGKPVKDGTAALYSHPDTFDIFKHKPTYLTKSDEQGQFQFTNLKPGTYFIYAFNDKNKNAIVDSRTERHGFLKHAINLKPDSAYYYNIPIISLDARDLKLISAKPYNTYFNIRTSKNVDQYQIAPLNPEDSLLFTHIYGEDQSSVHLFLNTQDSIPVQFQAIDSIGNTLDTAFFAKSNTRKTTPEKFTVSVENPQLIDEHNHFSTSFKVNKPISTLIYDSIYYMIDSTHIITFSPENYSWNKEKNKLFLTKEIPEELLPEKEETNSNVLDSKSFTKAPQTKKSSVQKLFIRQSFLISIDNDSSATMEQPVSVLQPETTGTIIVQTETEEENYITQILTNDYKVVQSTYNQPKSLFKNLPPGNYLIRLIVDSNGNKKWDTGSFYAKIEPEKIIYYLNEDKEFTTNIKANWELGPLLISY